MKSLYNIPKICLLGMMLFFSANPVEAFVISGSYVGDGTSSRTFTGFPFQPDFVIIKGVHNQEAIISTSLMPDFSSKKMHGGGMISNGILSIGTSSFTIGSGAEVNASGKTYYFTVFQNQAVSFNSGVYAGNGIDNRAITGIGFKPEFLFVMSDGGEDIAFATKDMVSGTVCNIGNSCGQINTVESLDTNGFTVGTDNMSNRNSRNYYWIAGKSYANAICVGTYTGNGADNRNLDFCSYQPDFVWIKSDRSDNAVFRNARVPGDMTLTIDASNPPSNYIQSLSTNGVQVGDNDKVNKNSTTYYYFSFKFSNVLQTNWLSFDVRTNQAGEVNAEWLVAEDENAIRYDLERSSDGINFLVVTSLPSINSTTQISYSVLDPMPIAGATWYRIRQISQSGNMSETDTKEIFIEDRGLDKMEFSVYPNPSNGSDFSMHFRVAPDEKMEIRIYDLSGKLHYFDASPGESSVNDIRINLNNSLQTGLYFVESKLGNSRFTNRIIVQ